MCVPVRTRPSVRECACIACEHSSSEMIVCVNLNVCKCGVRVGGGEGEHPQSSMTSETGPAKASARPTTNSGVSAHVISGIYTIFSFLLHLPWYLALFWCMFLSLSLLTKYVFPQPWFQFFTLSLQFLLSFMSFPLVLWEHIFFFLVLHKQGRFEEAKRGKRNWVLEACIQAIVKSFYLSPLSYEFAKIEELTRTEHLSVSF
jgi:hypothetical protein